MVGERPHLTALVVVTDADDGDLTALDQGDQFLHYKISLNYLHNILYYISSRKTTSVSVNK